MTVLRTSLRNFLAHKGRMALSAVAVLLSVAFVSGTLVFTDTMNTTFDKLFASTASDVTVSPKGDADPDEMPQSGRPESLPASLVERVGKVEGVKDAQGAVVSTSVTVVDAKNANIGPDGGAPTLALNWSSEALRSVEIASGHEPRGPTEVVVDGATAEKRGLKLGDELRTIAVTGDFTAKISGIVDFRVTNPGATVVYFDTATAQRELLGKEGLFTQVDVDAEPGVGHDALKRDIAAALGGGYKLQTAAEAADAGRASMAGFLDVMKYAMLGFAAIAFLVGIFLIVNTFSMLVAQRTREIGLMRAIGSSRKQVNRSVLVEAVLLGLVGSVAGVAAGVGLAVGLMKIMSSIGMELSTRDLTVKWTTPAVGLALGIVVTVLAAYVPARRAGKVSPMAALRDAGTPADGGAGRVRALLGLVLTAAGAAALVAAARAAEAGPGSLWLGLGVVLTLLGFVVIGPLLAGGVVRGLGVVVLRVFGPVGRMAERNALRNPRRTGATGAALMIGLALVAGLSVVGSSMVASATEELDRSVGADFIVQSGTGQPIVPQARAALSKVPGLDHVTTYKWVDVTVTDPHGKADELDLSATDPTYVKDVRREITAGTLTDAYGKDAMSVGSEYAAKHRVKVGDVLTVAFKGGDTAKLKVAAITADTGQVDNGAMYTNVSTVASYLPADRVPNSLLILAGARDGQETAAYEALKAALAPYPQYKVSNQADYKEQLRDQVGQLLNIVYGLLALAIVVAILGVVNTLALSVVERTREIGLMRAIGLSRRQLRRMIRLESVVIALFGALLGLGLGMGWGTAAQKLLALEGLGVLEIPWSTILTVFVGSAFVGLFAALVPAFRAGRMNVLNAIASE
ncbi:ABC transporter permease [Streptomyces sp. NPDC004520]|uniref:ABC transporter permease n=1 Tax=Streptomyces sp. NPDC004520 TaxID=3364702 RepID=UPI0036A35AF7